MKPLKLFAASILVMAVSPAGVAAGEETKFLPFIGPRLEAARYSSANDEFAWVGWMGATVDLVEKGKWSAYFDPNVETILGHRVRSFEAVQANYSLEVGGRREIGRGDVSVFFHHVSRHVQDRNKVQAIDWNFLGVKYYGSWPAQWHRRGGFQASVGVATLSSGVDYNWEMRTSADIDLSGKGARALYLLADLRLVGANATPEFMRDGLTDVRAELGFRRGQEKAQFALFVAFQRRSDALIERALVTDRALFGFRMRGLRRDVPAPPPLP